MRACVRPSILLAIACWFGGLVAISPGSARGEELPPEARQVLEQFVGTWDTSAVLARLLPKTVIHKSKGRGKCTATLGGRYYEFRTESTNGDSELQVMTYDAEAKLYRQWVFSSDGYSHAADGTWDPDTQTLRWTGSAGDTTFTIDDHFVEPGRLEWTLERLNADGEAVQGIKGTLIRTTERPASADDL